MKRNICIHGHFYQPSRANPWLETIEIQANAYPYHDWNERINAECYMSNTGSHILDTQKKIKKIMNNYSRISFNFGPTLLSWIKSNDMDTYIAIIDADRLAQSRFSGHGSAIAQTYNHIIMPLSSKRDKYIQTLWAIKDFESNFKRKPEGIWLSETAVDYETLEILAEFEIKFTILSPNQASRIKKLSPDAGTSGTDVSKGNINTRMPYICRLPNGGSIIIFFYDNDISNRMSFGNLLEDGEFFVKSLTDAPFVYQEDSITELVCAASDGERFGHHHRFGDMALAYALDTFENKYPGTITIFAEYLEKNKPIYEVEIKEDSSWSCDHGVCRWMEDCGCSTGLGDNKGWNQQWRVHLRHAVNDLSARLEKIYEGEIKKLINPDLQDIWEPVYDYVDIINDRSEAKIEKFLKTFMDPWKKSSMEPADKPATDMLKILEMYRQSMLMQSSDGWFFDDISRVEPIQVMQHACRAMEIAKEITTWELEKDFKEILKNAKSNIAEYKDGKSIYENYAKTATYGFEKIIASLAFESLFKADPGKISCHRIDNIKTEKIKIDHGAVIIGTAKVTSLITLETVQSTFAAYNFKNKDMLGQKSASSFVKIFKNKPTSTAFDLSIPIKRIVSIEEAGFDKKKNMLEELFDNYFAGNRFTLKDFLKDIQLALAEEYVIKETGSIKPVIASLFGDYENVLEDLSEKKLQNFFLDGIFPAVQEFIGEVLLYYKFKEKGMSRENLEEVASIIKKTSGIDFINKESFDILATKKINEITDLFIKDHTDSDALTVLTDFLNILKEAKITPNIWKMQNSIFKIKEKFMESANKDKSEDGKKRIASFKGLLDLLNIEYNL